MTNDELRMVDITPSTQQQQGKTPAAPTSQLQSINRKTRSNNSPLLFEPKGKLNYFEQRQQVNVMSFFMNPMMIMMAISLVMVYLIPKMTENMSPEELKEAQAKMATQQNPNDLLKNLFGGGKKDGDDSDVE